MRHHHSPLLSLVLVFLLFGAAVHMIKVFLDLPIVEFGYPSGKCVSVWSPGGAYSCDDLPPKYEWSWVADGPHKVVVPTVDSPCGKEDQ